MDKIPYVDHPELKINKNESTEMPFRYVKGSDGKPIMPDVSLLLYKMSIQLKADTFCQGMVELIKKDADKSVNDLF